MTNSNLSALTIAELKVIAADLDCTLLGDKRRKQSWIDAIEVAQERQAFADTIYIQLPIQFDTEDDFEAIIMSADRDSLNNKAQQDTLVQSTADLFINLFDKSVDEPWDSGDMCGESTPAEGMRYALQATTRVNYIANESKPVESATVEPTPSTKKGSVSVAASIACLLIFALTALCQILSAGIKYGYLAATLFGRWNPDLDIWYQLTILATNKRLDAASA